MNDMPGADEFKLCIHADDFALMMSGSNVMEI